MSDEERGKQRPEDDDESTEASKSKPTLVDATHKLKAEALRRLQLNYTEEPVSANGASLKESTSLDENKDPNDLSKREIGKHGVEQEGRKPDYHPVSSLNSSVRNSNNSDSGSLEHNGISALRESPVTDNDPKLLHSKALENSPSASSDVHDIGEVKQPSHGLLDFASSDEKRPHDHVNTDNIVPEEKPAIAKRTPDDTTIKSAKLPSESTHLTKEQKESPVPLSKERQISDPSNNRSLASLTPTESTIPGPAQVSETGQNKQKENSEIESYDEDRFQDSNVKDSREKEVEVTGETPNNFLENNSPPGDSVDSRSVGQNDTDQGSPSPFTLSMADDEDGRNMEETFDKSKEGEVEENPETTEEPFTTSPEDKRQEVQPHIVPETGNKENQSNNAPDNGNEEVQLGNAPEKGNGGEERGSKSPPLHERTDISPVGVASTDGTSLSNLNNYDESNEVNEEIKDGQISREDEIENTEPVTNIPLSKEIKDGQVSREDEIENTEPATGTPLSEENSSHPEYEETSKSSYNQDNESAGVKDSVTDDNLEDSSVSMMEEEVSSSKDATKSLSKDNLNMTNRGKEEELSKGTEEVPVNKLETESSRRRSNEEVEREARTGIVNRETSRPEEGTMDSNSKHISQGVENSSMLVEGNNDGVEKADNHQKSTSMEEDEVVDAEQEEPENLIPDDFYYDKEEFISRAFVTKDVPDDLLTLYHSFGYECTKRSNLYMLDAEHLIYAIGNFVQILNIRSKEQIYIRSLSGGGIGAVVVHPSKKYFAIAEKGVNPYIAIYEYPSLKLFRILRNGTEQAYSHLDFSPNGEKLASVGSYPDFMLTVWNWKQEKVVLRSKAFSQDVYKVAFSPENEGHLCSSGTGHIRFWTMASTFTGLKLQGELGRFGTTELSDIAGFVELPDGKVLSGSEWGNMLLWDGGLIKVEIGRKGKKFCHQGTIEQFYLDEGELITIGDDGYVKVWDFESIDVADSTDESKIFEMEPMSELKVGADVKLMFMVKSENPQESTIWYAQDGNGGIWKLDLSFSHTSQRPVKVQSYHAGRINGLAVSPSTHLAVTAGVDCTVRLFDYLSKLPLCYSRFNFPATCVTWIPKVIEPEATSLLTGFGDGVLRHLAIVKADSGGLAKKETSGINFKLTQVFKPHTKAITCVAISGDGKFLATGSDDNTVFFFQIGKQYKPIGYIETGNQVVSLDWSSIKQGNTLLVCCRDGTVFEVSCPDTRNIDTTKTFLLPLPGLKRKEFRFLSVKDELLRVEAEIKKAKEEEEKRKQEEEEKRKRRERGIIDDDEESKKEEDNEADGSKTEEEDEDEEETDAEKESEIHPPGCIVKGFYKGDSGRFWLSMDGWDAGYFYECSFPPENAESAEMEPVKSIKLQDQEDIVTRSCFFSKGGQFLTTGLENGAIRVYPLDAGDPSNLASFWSLNVHDNHVGSITDLSMSFDERFLLTAGGDGNFFVHSFMNEDKLKEVLSKRNAEIPVKKSSEDMKTVDDIEDPNYYSIELEKQKAEYDKMVKMAEEKKQKVRQTLGLCRREFKKLQNQAKELPIHLQLATSEFVIDPKMKDEIEKETMEKIDFLKRELAWNSEKQNIALEKIQKRFRLMIELDRIVLHAFNSEHIVTSYRATKLPIEFYSILGDNRKLVRRGTKLEGDGFFFQTVKRSSVTSRKPTSKGGPGIDEAAQGARKGQGSSKPGGKISKAIEKADQRRQRRLARQAQWDELNVRKPDDNYEDPNDIAAIKEAEQNIGDFKLKTAKDFVVPESQRVNAEKKRVQLMELQEQVYQRKHGFNQKLVALRNQKLCDIEKMKELIFKIENIQNHLPPSLHVNVPVVPRILQEEQPERIFEFSKEQLIRFRDGNESSLNNPQDGDEGGGYGGFGGFGGEAGPTSNKAASLMASTKNTYDQRGRSTSVVSSVSSQPRSSSSVQHDRGSPETIFEEHLLDDKPTDLEVAIEEEHKIRLTYERDLLLSEIRSLQAVFDAELRLLRHEKMLLDVELKNADLREITLYEELMLLKEFEKRENSLFSKVSKKLEEREEMREKVDECQLKIEAKKEELEKLQEKEKELLSTFSQTIGENNKFEAFLTKVFKKKIKRAKRKEENADSEEDSDEEESDDDYDSDEEDDSDGDDWDDSVCPPGCDQSIFDQVCQLREKRLDFEEAMTEEKKVSDALKKEMDTLTKKVRIIDSALKTAEADLEAFQLEKQQKLNELDVVVTLRLSQLQYVVNSTIPQDLHDCLVFNSSELQRLQRRIKELEKEKTAQKKLYKQRRQQHVQLIRDKKLMEAKILELDEKVKQTQMLKFGRLIDLEKLETVSVNRVAEELKEKLRAEEFSSAGEIADWEKKIDSYKAKLTLVTRENTKRLDTFTSLLQENKNLEHQLDSRQKNLGGEFQGNRQADLEERQRLVQLVQLQSQEMEALKEEINLLSKKGGHVLPPSQPPVPSSGRASASR